MDLKSIDVIYRDQHTFTEPIYLTDKVNAESYCHRQGWPVEDGPRFLAILAYHIAQRLGDTNSLDFPNWLDTVADARITDQPQDPHQA